MSTFPVHTFSDGNTIPGVGYGVGTAWFGKGVDRALVDAVKTALSVGFTHLDNAEAYANEESVGIAIKESGVARESLYLTSKVGPGIKKGDIRGSVKKSLSQLGTDHLDLLLLHWPYDFSKDTITLEDAWKVLEELKDEGVAKSIGVSNYRIQDLERTLAIARHRPVVNQIEIHPYVLKALAPLLEFQKKENIAYAAYAPTGPLTKLTDGPALPVLTSVAEAVSQRAGKKVEVSQVLLKLAAQLGAIVITTSGKDWRMKEQLAAGAIPDLTSEEIEEIKTISAPYHKRIYMQHLDTDTVY